MTPWEGNPHRPFCSQRCRMHDVGNWASDRYRVPGPPIESPDGEDEEDDEDEE